MADQQCTTEELVKRLAEVGTSLTAVDVAPYLPAVRALSVSDARRRFQTATSPDGVPWTPLRFPRPNGGGKVLRNFGALAASVTVKTTADTVIQGTNLTYAGVHQFGKTIVPTGGRRFISIPLTIEAMRHGGPRFPRVFPRRLFPAFRKGANRGALFEWVNGRRVFHYALVPSVTIPARPFLGFSPMFLEELTMLYGEIVERKLEALTGGR